MLYSEDPEFNLMDVTELPSGPTVKTILLKNMMTTLPSPSSSTSAYNLSTTSSSDADISPRPEESFCEPSTLEVP